MLILQYYEQSQLSEPVMGSIFSEPQCVHGQQSPAMKSAHNSNQYTTISTMHKH